ncbi:hypothetical protein PI124_g20744 [Phytophthora idaei]|nr:hypothetical protein PI126_g20014 [Phytophthora idaei]KAG3234201.1 hypothetical protein PI124_g20744 [Phytophthora idaei]
MSPRFVAFSSDHENGSDDDQEGSPPVYDNFSKTMFDMSGEEDEELAPGAATAIFDNGVQMVEGWLKTS